jgi:hypothetical protein
VRAEVDRAVERQLAHRLNERQPCPHGPLGVILMRLRVAEIHKHCGGQISVRGRSGGFIALTSCRRGALAGMMAAGALGFAVAGLSHCSHFQAKGAANRAKPLSAAAVDCAAAAASARRRSALLDPGKPMVH